MTSFSKSENFFVVTTWLVSLNFLRIKLIDQLTSLSNNEKKKTINVIVAIIIPLNIFHLCYCSWWINMAINASRMNNLKVTPKPGWRKTHSTTIKRLTTDYFFLAHNFLLIILLHRLIITIFFSLDNMLKLVKQHLNPRKILKTTYWAYSKTHK